MLNKHICRKGPAKHWVWGLGAGGADVASKLAFAFY